MSREQLLDLVRGREFDVFDRSIDVHISKLRKKLEENPKKPRLIQTVWGVGYRFVPSGG
jgi:two-component system phosphate regulon response regulator OmpR